MMTSWLLDTKSLSRALYCTILSAGVLTGCATIQTTAPASSYGVPVTDRTIAQRILDKSIENTAKTNINAMDPSLHRRSRIGVDSFYSEVLLTGEVPDEETKKNVVKIVTSMPDVKKVYDKLNIGPQKGTSYTVHDGYISSKINAKILANNVISTSQVQVVTDDGVVHVMGKLTPTQRGHLMNIVENTVGIKELVLLTELIDDNGATIDEENVTQETGLEPPDKRYYVEAQEAAYPVQPTAESNSQAQPAPTAAAQSDSQAVPNNQPPAAPRGPSDSAYIEMYKQEVPGW